MKALIKKILDRWALAIGYCPVNNPVTITHLPHFPKPKPEEIVIRERSEVKKLCGEIYVERDSLIRMPFSRRKADAERELKRQLFEAAQQAVKITEREESFGVSLYGEFRVVPFPPQPEGGGREN